MKTKLFFTTLTIMAVTNLHCLSAQSTNTLYFMDEIAERNNINPAFTPNCKLYIDLPILPNFYFNAGLNSLMLRDMLFNKNGTTESFLSNQANIDNFFTNLKPTLSLNTYFKLNILSFGFQVNKHYFTFDMGVHADINAYMPKDIFKLALYGMPDENSSNIFNLDKLGIETTLYSDIALGYMNIINDHWTVGGKAKLVMGYANISTAVSQLQLNASRENWTLSSQARINSSLPIIYETDAAGMLDPNTITMAGTSNLISLLYKPAGLGAAFDIGAVYKPIKNLTLSAAITDLGFIHWNKNLLTGTMTGNHEFDGFFETSIGDSISTGAITENITALGSEILETVKISDTKAYSTMLNANFTIGAEYGVLNNKISFGAMNRLRFNNRRISDEITVAANFRPLNWLKASLSYSFIDGRWGNLGLGLNLRAGAVNMYLIADYIPVSWANIASAENNYSMMLPYRTQRVNLQAGMALNLLRYSTDPDGDGVRGRRDICPDTDMDFLRRQCPDLKRKKQFVDKNGCSKDEDRDGIHNCYDKCPGTPEGVEVDSDGCPVDSDHDGVADYLDLCPDTPEGVEVDSNGCPLDDDADGVPNYTDQCPETPERVKVDSVGCPIDSDRDGIADYLDLCPGTPQGVSVDEKGCPIDSDGDGVADYLDLCPGTKPNVLVDEKGCPIDSDGDGVTDDIDKCPDKPGPASNYGCPELSLTIKNTFKKAMNGIQFETGKAIIKKISFPILNDIVKIMADNPDFRLNISGHTDNVGKADLNQKLSDDRAASVRKYLEEHGIAPERLHSEGFGMDRPVADNKTSKGRALNRRVEFEVVYDEFETIRVVNPELEGMDANKPAE